MCASQNESDGLPFPNTECEFSITDAVTADLIDKPFPRSCLSEDTKSGSESTKRKEATKDVTGAAVESAAVKESVDGMLVLIVVPVSATLISLTHCCTSTS